MTSSTLLRLVCVVLMVAVEMSLSRASPHPELGLVIHPAFSSPVYIVKDLDTTHEDSRVKKEAQTLVQDTACELNITESDSKLHEVKTVAKKSFSFFIKPETSFKKLVFKLGMQNIFHVSEEFHADEEITLSSQDLARSGDKQHWTNVRVEYYKYERRGFDRHGFKVSFGNMTHNQMTQDWWFFSGFRKFTVFAEGAAQVLFNCAPSSLEEPLVSGYVSYSMWVMVGLLIIAIFLLASLCMVWVYLRQQREKRKAPVSPIKYPVYEEFDEVVLEKIKQKVEALRTGKIVSDADTVVMGHAPRQDNFYVLEGSGYAELEGDDPEKHLYEDIDQDYKQRFAADSVYQSFSNAHNSDQNTYAIDNIYESLPGYEECLKGRGDATKISTRYS